MSNDVLYTIITWAGALITLGLVLHSGRQVRNARREQADELRTVARLADFLARAGVEHPGTSAVERLRPGFDWTVGGRYPPPDVEPDVEPGESP